MSADKSTNAHRVDIANTFPSITLSYTMKNWSHSDERE